ncbi:alpha/beta fold hydrolase [Thiobaca trueperi]|uniref:Pimeloyl-ACP methyl ester carboxylesterase n=1 Tax=Thiobaca trueperi TaxID=127458 RepID=A0A4R3MYE2_9GAMM|nr:alpha/beta hydrolase [Thiobaca trueperi]TCT19299.1 pimeloyl-ACP methyl ester carboxylesterase [Thiobaca trueperi]
MDNFESLQNRLADPDSQFLDANGFRIHYKRLGSGPTLILLLHGSFLSLRSWSQVIQPLAEQATVVAFDRPVCGLTSRPLPKGKGDALYSADAQSDLVAALIDKLGFEQAILIGNSTGGTIALLTALRHPERVRGLVLVGPMIYSGYATSQVPTPMLAVMKGLRPLFSRLMKVMIARLYDKAIRKFWFRQERLSDAMLATIKADFMIGPWDQAFFELFLATRHLGLDTRLQSLSLPTLVVTGEHDRAVKPEESVRLANELPGAVLEIIPDCGHLPQEERPDAFVTAIGTFLHQSGLLG